MGDLGHLPGHFPQRFSQTENRWHLPVSGEHSHYPPSEAPPSSSQAEAIQLPGCR
jgi:hypothetical protein